MTETLTLNVIEIERLKVILLIEQDELTIAEAAESLELSERQLYQPLQRYCTDGDGGLCHRLRGRKSSKAYAAELRTKALRLYREQYWHYGPTLLNKKLAEAHHLLISRQTATQWLVLEGLWTGSRKKRPHRKKRDRRRAIGSLKCASPKSRILTEPSVFTQIFDGLMSQWTTPCSCAASNPRAS